MRYVSLALYREGVSDQQFFAPLLRRVVTGLCQVHGREVVEVGEVNELCPPPQLRGHGLVEKVCAAAEAYIDGFDVLFLHADSDGDTEAAYQERVYPAFAGLKAVLRHGQRPVALVPVRMMEAWALADGDGIRAALGTNLPDEALGVPTRPADVERILDPKEVLGNALRVIWGKRRPHAKLSAYLAQLGEHIRLDRLRALPAYQRFEKDLTAALVELSIIPV